MTLCQASFDKSPCKNEATQRYNLECYGSCGNPDCDGYLPVCAACLAILTWTDKKPRGKR